MKVKISSKWLALALSFSTVVSSLPSQGYARNDLTKLITRDSNGLQDIVTWDEHSLFIRGERLVLWSGEVGFYILFMLCGNC